MGVEKKYMGEVHELFGHEKGCDCYDCMKETARRMYSELPRSEFMLTPTETEIKKLSEEMGNAVHVAWMEKRKKEKGWHDPAECPTKKSTPGFELMQGPSDGKHCPDCHPCMVPYAELPDSEKELDRAYPRIFIGILDKMGYKIERK